uniref:Long chain N-acylarginine synthase n=1 Tax=uncultured bacterium CSL11 TaxID=1091566 RepID=Q6XQL5_9BACT|nr:long chain N-acylarginine synthase [uncultured bacterium CSL11]
MQPEIFALRYEVYCLECGFLDAKKYRDGLESDEYDTGAAHFVAHNGDNELVGSLRLVHPPHSETFPFEERCYDLFDDIVLPPREESAEISRLVVRKNYRGRMGTSSLQGDGQAFAISGPVGAPFQRPQIERRTHSPEILLGLYRQIYQYSLRMGIHYWYAAMERPLARALARLHFAFTPIGVEVDYFGPVTPYMVDLRELERQMAANSPGVLAWFRGEM